MRRLLLVVILFLVPSVSEGLHQVEFRNAFGQKGAGPGQVNEPSGIAIGEDGRLYIADRDNRRVHVMSRDGKTLATWSSRKGDAWTMEEPSGIAVYGDKVFVTDAGQDAVLVFSTAGAFLERFGSGGSGPKQFDDPRGITVHQGILYVADTGNHRVQSLSLDGIFLSIIGRKGSDTGELREPTDIAIDHLGIIYVADAGNDRVQAFTSDGRHHRSYHQMKRPASLAVDGSGLYVADAGNYRVRKYAFNGEVIVSFGTRGDQHAQFRDISGITLDEDGNVFVADAEKHSIQVFRPEKMPERVAEVAPPIHSVRWISDTRATVNDIAWNGEALFGTSARENAIYLMQHGTVRRVIKGEGKETFDGPTGIAVDPEGYVFFSDTGNDRIVKINREGRIMLTIGGAGSRDGFFSAPRGIAISPSGILYIADSNNERVQFFNTSGVFLGKIDIFGALDQYRFDNPVDVALDHLGNIYVVDEGKHVVVKFNSQGRYISAVGVKGTGNGQFSRPAGIVVTPEEVIVLDAGNERVQIFDLEGRFLRKFGAPGAGKGDFREPGSLAMKNEATFFVADTGNGRVQELRILYTPRSPLALKALAEARDVSLSWAKNHESFFSHYKIYRSDGRSGFEAVASPSDANYVDRNLKPDATYYYRVSAVAKGGNESARSRSVEVRTGAAAVSTPSDLSALPGEREITLTWKPPAGGEKISHYVVYRQIDGRYRAVGKVRNASYTDRELIPETAYSYAVTAVTVAGTESRGMPVTTATVRGRPDLELVPVKLHDIFPRAFRLYEKEGIGRIRATNNTRKPISTIRIRFRTAEFMDAPVELFVSALGPKESAELDIRPVTFSSKLLTLREDTAVTAEISATYLLDGGEKQYGIAQKLMVIVTGKQYTEAERRRFYQAIESLDARVLRAKADAAAGARISDVFHAPGNTVRQLRARNLSYGEAAVCLFIVNGSKKSPEDILAAKGSGQEWHFLLGMFDLSISDITHTLGVIEQSLVVKKQPQRKRETERYIQ